MKAMLTEVCVVFMMENRDRGGSRGRLFNIYKVIYVSLLFLIFSSSH